MPEVSKILSKVFKGRTVIVGMGNVLKGDDAFGPRLVERLKGDAKAVCIDAGSAPENYTGKIIKERPETIIIADAVHLGLKPGECDVLRKDDIVRSGFTTHDISPVMFIEYLENQTGADIYMLAVQPETVGFGEEMSDSVKKALEEISVLIKEAQDA